MHILNLANIRINDGFICVIEVLFFFLGVQSDLNSRWRISHEQWKVCANDSKHKRCVCMHIAHPHSLLESRKIIIRMALHEQVSAVVYSMGFSFIYSFRLCGCGLKPASTDIWCNQARSKTPRIHYQFLSLYHLSICFSIWIICKWTFELLRETEWMGEREAGEGQREREKEKWEHECKLTLPSNAQLVSVPFPSWTLARSL